MAEVEHRSPETIAALGKVSLLALAGASAAAWFWFRQGEAPLRKRTAERLSPRSGKHEA